MMDECPIEFCIKCGKKTEPIEWLDAVGVRGTLMGMGIKKQKRFKCSKCGHTMSAGVLDFNKESGK